MRVPEEAAGGTGVFAMRPAGRRLRVKERQAGGFHGS